MTVERKQLREIEKCHGEVLNVLKAFLVV